MLTESLTLRVTAAQRAACAVIPTANDQPP
jgi:hypothetical protein